ncbi:MAG: ParB N-terminal domain-containing protein [Succinivibrio sp.]|nr:ParB N-terminal domain-containing protein [Succinivibrio sp.]
MSGKHQDLNLMDLLPDEHNPRFSLPATAKENELWMQRYGNLDELMAAIGEVGYNPAEPLLVVPADAGKYTVVEGNRRLCALRLLKDPTLAQARAETFKKLAANAVYKPTTIPCIIYDERSEIEKYLGFRHVTGIKEWGAYEKARFLEKIAAQLRKESTNLQNEEVYRQIAHNIGSRRDYVEKLLTALALFNLADQKNFYGCAERVQELNFSWMSSALSYRSITSFLKLRTEDGHLAVSSLDHERFALLFKLLYRRGQHPRVRESRDIAKVARIAENEEALQRLCSGEDSLDTALGWLIDRKAQFTLGIKRISDLLGDSRALAEDLVEEGTYLEELSGWNRQLDRVESLVNQIRRILENGDRKVDYSQDLMRLLGDANSRAALEEVLATLKTKASDGAQHGL